MTIVVAMVLIIAALIFIALPFFKKVSSSQTFNVTGNFRESRFGRDLSNSMLHDLESDFQSGLLSEEDYRELELRYKTKAFSSLQDVEGLKKGTEIELDIESQVQKLRRRNNRDPGTDAEEDIRKLRKGQAKFCPRCGTKTEDVDLFCAGCGTKLK